MPLKTAKLCFTQISSLYPEGLYKDFKIILKKISEKHSIDGERQQYLANRLLSILQPLIHSLLNRNGQLREAALESHVPGTCPHVSFW